MAKNYWLVKSEPEAYSWDTFVKDGRTAWTGVRNFQARNNLRAMKKGDVVAFYHSVTDKQIVGLAKVDKEAYPDATAKEGDWACVDLVPAKPLKQPVTLAAIKARVFRHNLSEVSEHRNFSSLTSSVLREDANNNFSAAQAIIVGSKRMFIVASNVHQRMSCRHNQSALLVDNEARTHSHNSVRPPVPEPNNHDSAEQ